MVPQATMQMLRILLAGLNILQVGLIEALTSSVSGGIYLSKLIELYKKLVEFYGV